MSDYVNCSCLQGNMIVSELLIFVMLELKLAIRYTQANPFDPLFKDYFKEREKKIKESKLPTNVATAGLDSISLMRA